MAVLKSLVTLSLFAMVCTKYARQTHSAIEEVERYIEEKKSQINPRYRLHYHVAGPVGWINDPNGFSFYKGKYHMFFQFYPYNSAWGPMHWGHVSSPDLVHWEHMPTALIPEEENCFSGSAVVDGDQMVLMYTAHINTDIEPFFNETQYLAVSDDGVEFTKYSGNPVIPRSPNGAPDFRDPKAWKHGDYWYVIIGSKTLDDRGRVVLYRSENLEDWEFLTVLAESTGNMGYMWECPDFFELDGKHVLLMSPQGMKPEGDRFKNIHQTGYIIGDFDYDTFSFTPEVEFQEIDFGHDFYASQTTEVNGKRYLVAWFNSWDVDYPEAVDGWAGALTIIRELKRDGNRILVKPVESMVDLREDVVINGELKSNDEVQFGQTAEILVEGNLEEDIELLIEGKNGGGKAWVRWSTKTGKVAVDRGSDDIRQVEWAPIGSKSWRIFLDASSLELFCGEGEVVFSTRVYPDGSWKVTNLSPQSLKIEAYSLKRSVPV